MTKPKKKPLDPKKVRTYDGGKNNKRNPDWGKAGTPLLRLVAPPAYDDGISTPRVGPNPRAISNIVCREEIPAANKQGLSDFVWAWGQFLDHELDLTPGEDTPLIVWDVPDNEKYLPGGRLVIHRSNFDIGTGQGSRPAEQINELSAYVDATNVYGPSEERADVLRTGPHGKLKTSRGNLLPFNRAGFPNENGPRPDAENLFLAGDRRVNEHVVLICMHTLFMREHNRRCAEIIAKRPDKALSDEDLFQRARRYVGALMQVITYEEFLPTLLGPNAIGPYDKYKDDVDASISNLFATACYRLGHSMLSEFVPLVVEGHRRELLLADGFFRPELVQELGIEPFMAGLASHRMREIDGAVIESVRSFLFHAPGGNPDDRRRIGDLPAFNIIRGREHGLPDYNTCRKALGLKKKSKFRDITSDPTLQRKLEEAYDGDVDAIDPWVGGLVEDHVRGANVGELIFAVLKDQFERCRDGDRFWYENDKVLKDELEETGQTLDDLKSRKLSDVIRENTDDRVPFLQGNVFYARP